MADDTVILTIPARWLAPLLAFAAEPGWFTDPRYTGLMVIPDVAHGALLVASDGRGAVAVVRDPTVRVTGMPDGKMLCVGFPEDAGERATVHNPRLWSVNNHPHEATPPEWLTPKRVDVLAMGLGTANPETKWYVHAAAPHPAETAEDEDAANACLHIDRAWAYLENAWVGLSAVESRFEAAPTTELAVQGKYLAAASKFGWYINVALGGQSSGMRLTFRDAPEATVYLMPLKWGDGVTIAPPSGDDTEADE